MKKVYISLFLHGNMCYDRYTKQEIRAKFPEIYATGIRAMHRYPQVTAHIDFPGLTTLSLKHYAPWFLAELKPLVERGQVMMAGCQYAASHAMCSDEESDLMATRLGMEIMRDELQPDVSSFITQEWPFHPQSPFIDSQCGATRTFVMRDDWHRPRRVRGLDGSEVIVYSRDRALKLPCLEESLEEFYDQHEDGTFMLAGGDFEDLGNVGRVVAKMEELAAKGKVIEWMTADRYECEIGVHEVCDLRAPFGRQDYDYEASPSFSRWVSDPEDIIWHGHAIKAMDAIRSAGFAKLSARLLGLGDVDVPIEQSMTTLPDNPWDAFFEHAVEYPETEAKYLSADGQSTLLSRAWHHLLIGLNSDASGFRPWQPRTRHRNTVMQESRALSQELIGRFARQLAARLSPPAGAAQTHVLALNPLPARSAEVSWPTEGPMTFTDSDGTPIPTRATLRDGAWLAQARIDLPAYGYKLLGLISTNESEPARWAEGNAVEYGDESASLAEGVLSIRKAEKRVDVSLAPFRLSDPAGVAETEEVVPNWEAAVTRVRQRAFGADLEVMTELAWAMWLRLVIGLRADRIEVLAEVHADMPRRIGRLKYYPDGLRLEFRGQPGRVLYDIPYATVEHPNAQRSFIAVQRFVALEGKELSFALVPLGGNQSFEVAAEEGLIGAGLGASKEGRPDVRPLIDFHPDGTATHVITSGGDAMIGTYEHRFALVFATDGGPFATEVAQAARRLRTEVPIVPVQCGDGEWPAEGSLLAVEPNTAYVTAFRVTPEGCEIVVSDLSGKGGEITCSMPAQGRTANTSLGAYGIATVRL